MQTIGERLTSALERFFPGDRKAFQRAIREQLGAESGEGTSYPAVLGYFAGSTAPSVTWLDAAADLMGVRAAWLAFGDGPPTAPESRAESKAERAATGAVGALALRDPLLEETFRGTLARLARFAASGGRDVSDEELAGLAERLGAFLMSGVQDHVLGERLMPAGTVQWSERAHHAHMLTTLHAVVLAIPERMLTTETQEDQDA